MLGDNRPIGVFDSGVGGLTVLRALQDKLPNESTVYLGDLARCPYGPRPQAEVRRFAVEIADLFSEFDIKALVIACNTATAAAYGELSGRYGFPVVGVVRPGAYEAARVTRNGRIGVVATIGTVASRAYTSAITSRRPDAVVVERSASWLVPLIERGALARRTLCAQLEHTMVAMRTQDVDTLILGCTHFPIVRDIFDLGAGSEVTVLDSADTTANEIEELIAADGMASIGPPSHRILVTGPAEAFAARAQAMFQASPDIEEVDLVTGVLTGT
jgi:glutamate racemase